MRTCPYCHRPYPNACAGCGEPIHQPERGRPRKWCDRPGCQVLRRRHGDAQNAQKVRETTDGCAPGDGMSPLMRVIARTASRNVIDRSDVWGHEAAITLARQWIEAHPGLTVEVVGIYE